jgi:hypothetical protein
MNSGWKRRNGSQVTVRIIAAAASLSRPGWR